MTKTNLLISTFIFLFLIGSADFYITKNYLNAMLKDNIDTKSEHIIHAIKHEQERMINAQKKNIEMILSVKGVKEAISSNNREELYKILLPRYNNLMYLDKYINLIHFHLSNGKSFLRMHKKDKFGDDISKLRESIKMIHKNKKSIVIHESGIFDKNILTLRVIEPIFLNSKYIGAIEIGIDISKIFDSFVLNVEDNTDLAIFINKNRRLEISKINLDREEIFNKYLFKHSKNYNKEFKNHLNENGTFEYEDKYFFNIVYDEIFKKIDLETLGKLQIVIDISTQMKLYEDKVFLSFLKFILILFILTLLVGYYLNYQETLEKKIKSQINEIKLHQDTIVSQGKFAAMGEMIGMIAHQWRQPLNVIILNISSIQMMVHQKKMKKAQLDIIIKNITQTVNYMNQTIDDFRNFLKDDNKVNEVKIGDLAYKPKHLIEAELEAYNVSFEFESSVDTNKVILLDSTKFYQVVLNLYKNSIDEFKTKNIKDPYIKVNISSNEHSLIITVEDNAGGIPEEIIYDIFNPYFSTKGKNGTGIGLYMSKKIIQDHIMGDIKVENINSGAIFTIEIPFEQDLIFSKEYKCLNWNKNEEIFIRDKKCNNEELLKESSKITNILDCFFINYTVKDNGDIKVFIS